MASESPKLRYSSLQKIVVWTVGLLDGISVGTSDACSLGLLEGIDVVGDALGILDGVRVGAGDDGGLLGRTDGVYVVGVPLGVELGCAVKMSVGDRVGLEEGLMDGVAVVGLLEGRSLVIFVVVIFNSLFFASWRFFRSSSLAFTRSSLRCFFLSICFSVKRLRRLGWGK